MDSPCTRLSVRRLVEFSLRAGDLTPANAAAMYAGMLGHKARQQHCGDREYRKQPARGSQPRRRQASHRNQFGAELPGSAQIVLRRLELGGHGPHGRELGEPPPEGPGGGELFVSCTGSGRRPVGGSG